MAGLVEISEDLQYPTSDGKPMAETDLHRDNMVNAIEALKAFYASDPMVYVSGNLLMYYVPGDKRRHVSPDVFVVHGVPKRRRLHYLVWKEGKGPDIVIEITSKSTRREDLVKKFQLYRDTLKVREYFLFDPNAEYLDPSLQGYRLDNEQYLAIAAIDGRLPSEVLQLHVERDMWQLRFWNPVTRSQLLSPGEEAANAKALLERSEESRRSAQAETERLRRELEELRRRLPPGT